MGQLATIEDSILAVIPEAKKLIKAHNLINIEAEQNYAIQQLYKNDFNVKIAMQSPIAVQNAIRNLSSIGISLNPALKHAYLVPRDGQICLDISYMGLLHLAQQEGSILWGQAMIVYAEDVYTNNGVGEKPTHTYTAFGDRGEKVGVYCCVKLPGGDFLTEEMSADEVQQVRNTSKAKDSGYSPWKTFETEMWRKSVVKRGSKYWPKSGGRLDDAIQVLNQHEGISEHGPRVEKEVKDAGPGLEDKMAEIETLMVSKVEMAEKLIERGGTGFRTAMLAVNAEVKQLCGKLKVHPKQYTDRIKEKALEGAEKQEQMKGESHAS